MTLPPLSLRGKLFGFAAVLVLVPGVLLGLLADRSARDSLQTVIGRQLAREALFTAERLSALLRSERGTLESFARQDLMREVRVADIDKRVSQALSTLRDGSSARLDYLVVDGHGLTVAASSPAWIGDPRAWRGDLAALVRDGSRYHGPFRSGSKTALGVATTIPDPDGGPQALGTLIGLLDWKQVTAILDEARRDLSSQELETSLLLVDETGRRIGVSGGYEGPAPTTGDDSRTSFAVDEANEAIIGWAPLDEDLVPWRLLVVEPLDHALAPATALTRRLALMMAVALAAALLLATLAARRVVRPLSELTNAIRGMAGGDFGGATVPVRSDDEVGVLARSFNQITADLDRVQRNLVEAEKFAFVGELASGVAHEVRTSLGVLRSSAQILGQSLSEVEGSEIPELVEMIRDEVGRLSRVVDDLLTLDRPRAMHPEPTPLSLPLLRAAEFAEPQAKQKDVQIFVDAADTEAIVSCDREAIQHVCVNLLVNAVQSLEAGGRVALRISGPGNGFASFSVSDDGPGVPDDLRDKIFEPFMTGRDSGVGLGLTFVKRVVHEHGGHISVEPSPGGGACFHVTLPLAEDAT